MLVPLAVAVTRVAAWLKLEPVGPTISRSELSMLSASTPLASDQVTVTVIGDVDVSTVPAWKR